MIIGSEISPLSLIEILVLLVYGKLIEILDIDIRIGGAKGNILVSSYGQRHSSSRADSRVIIPFKDETGLIPHRWNHVFEMWIISQYGLASIGMLPTDNPYIRAGGLDATFFVGFLSLGGLL